VTRGPWQVRYTRQAEKDLGRLDPPIRRRVVVALDGLAEGDAAGVVQLQGTAADYRLRVGGWRVIFRRDRGRARVAHERAMNSTALQACPRQAARPGGLFSPRDFRLVETAEAQRSVGGGSQFLFPLDQVEVTAKEPLESHCSSGFGV